MSVVVQNERKEYVLICKGAVEEVLSLCNKYETKEGTDEELIKAAAETSVFAKLSPMHDAYSSFGQ